MSDEPERLRYARAAQRRSLLPYRILAVIVLIASLAGIVLVRGLPVALGDVMLKILGVALAVGLDVLALSIAVGITGIPWRDRLRLGAAFSVAEVLMQLLGFLLGSGVGALIGEIASYAGFAVLAALGAYMIRESFRRAGEAPRFAVTSGWGLVVASASVSLDSLGIGVSLPGVPLPLAPLLGTVAISTIIFTAVGLLFGSRLGTRYRNVAERASGAVLIILAITFTIEHLVAKP